MNFKHGSLIRVKSIKEMLETGSLDNLDRICFKDSKEKFDISQMSFLCNREFYISKIKIIDNEMVFSVYDYDFIHADRFVLTPNMVELLEDEEESVEDRDD